MPRKKPNVIMEWVDPDTGKCEQIIEGEVVYTLFYKDMPVNIRSFNKFFDYPGPRYKRTSFGNPAHAYNLAERLNKKFNTTDFHVKVFK